MRILIAPDSYKGCLSAAKVADAMRLGALDALPDASIDCVPIADGGEGTLEAFFIACGGEMRTIRVHDPLLRLIDARYLVLPDGCAVVEMAMASGLPLLSSSERNPLTATTYGTGELVAHAVRSGAKRVIIGIGGSATNDGGAGFAQALGARITDTAGHDLPPGGAALVNAARVDLSALRTLLSGVSIQAACDVTNPLCGPDGASAIYGPQKGATPGMVRTLDTALGVWAHVLSASTGVDISNDPGSGAAGGLGGGLKAMCGATLTPGFALVASATSLRERMRGCDLVLTGEGRTDAQTANGKAPAGVGQMAGAVGAKAICVSGALKQGYEALYSCGITACFSIADGPLSLEACIAEAPRLIRNATRNAVRLLGQ